ncbi:GntR family transcriptional regulator [Schumannella sp. 10F1B-5-1]|uniref:GntR family transcriptional regulator n=1 Tax=Schumannella sp. 10F1B-5-1 TaxID=2590780 RepID=UPI001132996B|nr:GntR family transcriptional regulator [Schumannella sp. 10F1B-5-1]TPW71593.1 GntR family transcriptional regulator [Schumannella sp. 10F1B-5-1]
MAATIERDSPVAYYEQLFGILRERIVAGEFPPDVRLPSEMELCREFGLSRATVRQTMSKLESEGYARRVARRGVFASSPEQPTGWTVQEGFLESQVRHGRTGIATKVVDARFLVPAQHVSEALETGEGTEVFALQRVRSMDGRVAMFSTNWFPRAVGQTIADDADVVGGTGSVNETLRRAGHFTHGAKRVIRAMRPTELVASSLGIDADQPVLRVRSLSWDQSGVRFDYYETWVLTDIIPLEVSVSAS